MSKGDFGNKRNSKGFDKNKQNINKKGAPVKVLTSLTDYFEKTYGNRPPKGEVLSLMEYVESLPIEKLIEFLKDKSIPVIIQAYGRLLLTGEQKDFRKVQAAEMINDRLHGRPKQATELTGDININWKEEKTYE